jgi:ribosomal protein S18 acetylase RimI-like enzyme
VAGLLARLERYYDTVPRRGGAQAERIGSFTLFVREGVGWPYYARPALGAPAGSADEAKVVRRRQRELGVPEQVEWVAETAPWVRAAVTGAGLATLDHPLHVLDRSAWRPAGTELVRRVRPDDELALIGAVAPLGFAAPGSAPGPAGLAELRRAAAGRDPADVEADRRSLAGPGVRLVAELDGAPVAVGAVIPIPDLDVAEIVGVATLPAYRRRGLATALTTALVQQAGVGTVFLSAGDAAVARVYERVGFRLVGTACIAEPQGQEDRHD